MNILRLSAAPIAILFAFLVASPGFAMEAPSPRIQAIQTILKAVNSGNAELYASVFAEDAVVKMYEGPVRVNGRESLQENRKNHFLRFPKTHAEIIHLAEIGDDIVVMHDRVWLSKDQGEPAELVEVFRFNDSGLIEFVDVIQPAGLLPNPE